MGGGVIMSILFTFPGQGPQEVGMLHRLPDDPATQQLLAEASSVLHEDVLQLDTHSALANTRAVQLCLLIAGVAYARQLQQAGVQPEFVSGLSIGAYPAAVIAGALSFTDAVRLVALRGQFMHDAYPSGYGLSAIVGLQLRQVEQIAAGIHSQTTPLYIANINTDDQIVLAGSDAAMAAARTAAQALGARKTQKLNVSVPSHCALLDSPAQQLEDAFSQVDVKRPSIAYLSSSSARVLWQPERIRDDLIFNMARTVRWYDAMSAAVERNIRLAIEMPTGAVLTGLTRPLMAQAPGRGGEAIAMSQQPLATIQELAKRELLHTR
jgi:malonate decarboxylase epsilon subunit